MPSRSRFLSRGVSRSSPFRGRPATNVLILGALLGILASSCSDNPAAPGGSGGISFAPAAGPPGTVVKIRGFDSTVLETARLAITIGGHWAPAVVGETGEILTSIPLFLDANGGSVPPSEPVDLRVAQGEKVLFEVGEAITVTALSPAPGTTAELANQLVAIHSTLESISTLLAASPSAQSQYLTGHLAALDSLLTGAGPSSLPSSLQALEADSTRLAVLDAVFAHTGILEGTRSTAALLADLLAQLQGAMGGGGRALIDLDVSDSTLAWQMQLYVILQDFGEQVIGQSAQQWSEYVATVTGLIGIAYSIPYVQVTSLVVHYLNFFINKIALGLFPADLHMIDLTLAQGVIEPGGVTNATIVLHARNVPPQMTVLDIVDEILTAMGAAGSPPQIQSFRDVLLGTFDYFLGIMRSAISAYAQAHPELSLNPDLFSLVPPLQWQATAADPVYLDCETYTSTLIEPLVDALNWQALPDVGGEARIYVRPSTDRAAYFFPSVAGYQYSAGAFGINMTQSPTVSVYIRRGLVLELTFPVFVARDTVEELQIRAGYPLDGGGVDYTAGIQFTVDVTGGSPAAVTGVSDAQGSFSTEVSIDDNTATTVDILVTATGANGEYAEGTAAADIIDAAGLAASYSTGATMLEGPIDHGCYTGCCNDPPDDPHCMYQAVCVPVADAPVNWATGGVDVVWQGEIYSETGGTYIFTGWFDGDVMIQVNGTTVIDEFTHGAPFSGSVALPDSTWVPVLLTFSDSIGSHTMMFKWLPPGQSGVSHVPRNLMRPPGP